MDESQKSPNKSEQDKKLNPNANTTNGNNDDHLSHTPTKDNNKETKFNASSIISPQSTKSLNLTDNNSNHSTNTTTSNITASSTNNTSPSHPNINRTFIKNSKLTPNTNTSRYNYVQNQNNNNNNASARPEQKCKENQNEPKNKKMIPFDNELVLQNLIRAQIEYLFSDYHLTNDTYLLARMQDNPQHWLSIDELCHNQKIRCLTIKKDRILRALRESKYLQLSPEQDKVRRPDFTLPKLKPNRDLRRTVFLYGIPSNKTEQDIRKLLSQYGHIKRIHFQPHPTETGDKGDEMTNNDNNIDDEAPNKAVAQLIMKKKFLFPSRYSQSDHDTDNESNRGFDISTPKGSNDGNNSDCSSRRGMSDYAHPVRNPNGDAQDFSHLKTCFVVFESQSQATKCVKARVRAIDGMRCIHKYDYNKVAKKFRTAQMKGEKLSFSPPPPNYQSPRVSGQGEKYMHNNRGRSPGAQSDGRYNNYGNNNRSRYRSFGNGQGNNNGYGNNRNRNDNRNRDYNSYRDRSHSQSSQGSDRGSGRDRDNYNNNRNNNNNNGGGYQSYRQGRYERNGQGNRNQRSQTPNSKYHGNNNNNNQNDGNKFYNILGRNQNRGGNDDNDKENHGGGQQRSRGLGRRQDRDSHDGSKDRDNSSDVRTYHSNRNKWNQNPTYNRNQNRHAQSTSPQRSQSVGHSVGNQSTMSTNSEYKPILNSMNKGQGQNGHKGDNNTVGQPQQDLRKVQSGGSKQNVNDVANVANQPTYAKKRQPVRAATPNMKPNGSFVSPMGQHDVLSPPQELKKTQSSMQPQTVNNAPNKKLQQQPLQRSVSANTAPTNASKGGAKGGREPAAPQLYHPIGGLTLPTRQDAADLRAAGYNHELYYLPDDPNFLAFDDIYQDPLIAYDVYFGVDQSGKPTSTSAAAQQLQQQKTQIQTQPKTVSQSQRHHTQSQYAQQSQSRSQHGQHAHSQHAHATYVPQQPRATHHTQQQYATTPTHHSSAAYAQQSAQYPQQQHPQLSSHSYSAHSYQSGPRSAPYGPVQNTQQQQYRAEQWQLDKLEKFKAQKQAEQAAQHHQHQVVQQQKPATALSVLSSSN